MNPAESKDSLHLDKRPMRGAEVEEETTNGDGDGGLLVERVSPLFVVVCN